MAADSQKPNIMPLEKYAVTALTAFPKDGLTGRRKIMTAVKDITEDNVVDVLNKALAVHAVNAAEITYLYGVYRGRQDILDKKKIVRDEINNKVVVNRANEIVAFKTAYLLNEPVQYVSHGGDDAVSEQVNLLNEMMRAESKEAKDKEIVDWMHICGVAARLCLPDTEAEREGAPFHIETLDPREAFVIYHSGVGRKPLAGVILQVDENEQRYAMVYTKEHLFTVRAVDGKETVEDETNEIGEIPIVEYINNAARIGAFEMVLPLLNSINTLESNAVDSVQDFVNGFDVFQNCEIADGDYGKLNIGGQAISIKTVVQGMEAKVYRVYSELNQSGVQTRIDDQTDAYLEICGMPNRNGGLSTSDTGTAVLFRDGWSAAASRAKDTATLFKRSEREFDCIVLKICRKNMSGGFALELKDFEAKFPFGNLTNLQSLAQTFSELLNNDKVHPAISYQVGAALFKDSEEAYRMGMQWWQDNKAKEEETLSQAVNNARLAALNANTEQTDDGTA